VTVAVTLLPFSFAGLIASLSALDYLGFGLPPTQPSWGDLLRQGRENWTAWWIGMPTVACMVGLLVLVNFVGEAVREAFDARKGNCLSLVIMTAAFARELGLSRVGLRAKLVRAGMEQT
jgi:ABC-type microcin C transport system permease subunit YejE